MKLSLKALGLSRTRNLARDATGTIGLEATLKNTPGGKWIALKATVAAFILLPYCIARRQVCKSPDFKPPLV